MEKRKQTTKNACNWSRSELIPYTTKLWSVFEHEKKFVEFRFERLNQTHPQEHLHKQNNNGVLWFNPNSCDKRQFDLEITLCRMTVGTGTYRFEKVLIDHEVTTRRMGHP